MFVLEIFMSIKIIYTIIMILLIGIIFYIKHNYAKLRGKYGEEHVIEELSKLPKEQYKIINDIIIEDKYGTHQIDHIVISVYGIFVIETKNYSGTIVGNISNKYWTYYARNKNYKIYNPIRQNYGHKKTLAALLNLDEKYFIPIVCFADSKRIKVKSCEEITTLTSLAKKIEKYQEKILDISVDEIFNQITNANIKNNKILKSHINSVKGKIN